jgi:hypothetical protein
MPSSMSSTIVASRMSGAIGNALRTYTRDLNVGVLKEAGAERRVTMVPAVAQKFIKDGYTMNVEAGAGAKAGFSDKAYEAAGCIVLPRDEMIKK